MHTISPSSGKNPAEKAVYLLPKKAVYLYCQKSQSTSTAKNGSLPQEEEEAGRRRGGKKKKEAEEEQNK